VGTPNKKAGIERYRPFLFFRIVVPLDQAATLIQFSVSSAGTREQIPFAVSLAVDTSLS
jgi:hypothetical protein